MIQIALRIAYVLFLAWLGLNVFLFILLGVVTYFRRLPAAKEAQGVVAEADAHSMTHK